jgi:primosomal protein N' (replication factor Y)
MCAIGDVYRGAMPSALLRVKLLSLKKQVASLPKVSYQMKSFFYQALQQQSSLKVQDIINILNKKNIFPVIQKMIDKNVLVLQEEIQESYKPKLARYIRLQEQYNSNEGLSQLTT